MGSHAHNFLPLKFLNFQHFERLCQIWAKLVKVDQNSKFAIKSLKFFFKLIVLYLILVQNIHEIPCAQFYASKMSKSEDFYVF